MFLVARFFRGNLVQRIQRGKTSGLTESKLQLILQLYTLTKVTPNALVNLWTTDHPHLQPQRLHLPTWPCRLQSFDCQPKCEILMISALICWFLVKVLSKTWLSTWLHWRKTNRASFCWALPPPGAQTLPGHAQALKFCRWSLHGGARVNWTFIQKQLSWLRFHTSCLITWFFQNISFQFIPKYQGYHPVFIKYLRSSRIWSLLAPTMAHPSSLSHLQCFQWCLQALCIHLAVKNPTVFHSSLLQGARCKLLGSSYCKSIRLTGCVTLVAPSADQRPGPLFVLRHPAGHTSPPCPQQYSWLRGVQLPNLSI